MLEHKCNDSLFENTLFEMIPKSYKSKEHLSIIEFQHKHCSGDKNWTFLLYLLIPMDYDVKFVY